MARMRFSLAGLMCAVVIVGADIQTFRLILAARRQIPTMSGFSLDLLVFALGVLPMGSLLAFLGLGQVRRLAREGESSPFQVGFQNFGWLAVFLFVVVSALAPGAVHTYVLAVGNWTLTPIARMTRWAERMPERADLMVELTFSTAVLSLPELAFALLGGWLLRNRGKARPIGGTGMNSGPADRASSPSVP